MTANAWLVLLLVLNMVLVGYGARRLGVEYGAKRLGARKLMLLSSAD